MNIPSFHQNDLFNELAKNYDKFEVIYANAKDEERINQGWNVTQIQHYESKIIGIDLKLWQLIIYVLKNRKAVHIVNGIWAEKSLFFVILLLNIFNVSFLIYSEAPVPTKNRSSIKKTSLKFIVKPLAKLLIIKAKGFLAVSIFAVKHFESLGVKNNKIYRFGYFRKVKSSLFIDVPADIPQTSLIFVGQLIKRKGIETLLEAIKIIERTNQLFHLTIIGKGELKPLLQAFISKNQLENTVTLSGVINSKNITDYIKKADLLILPSVFDGWGMVINEALQVHVPVLISDQCGAKELVRNNQNGLIFQHDSIESLVENLQKFLDLSYEKKKKMKRSAGEMGDKISISVIGKYLNLCIKHCLEPQNIKPLPPWLNE
jgi:glycosyltransferase involved in cell wall biosynthesis